jgi:glutaredoxin-related protein
MSSFKPTDSGLKTLIDPSKNDQEPEFLKNQGIDSLDPLKPRTRDIDAESPAPKLAHATVPNPEAQTTKVNKSDLDSAPASVALTSSDILYPFLTTRIIRINRKRDSTFYPSSYMLSYLTHLINDELVDNFYFKRSCPEYHPYILRLYFGVLFVIQTLRAMNEVGRLDSDSYEFLDRFVSAHKLESLSIPGPMLPLFKALCVSDSEIPSFGKIVPILPSPLGPDARRDMMVLQPQNFSIPHVPGIMALIASIDGLMNGTNPSYPSKRYVPVDGTSAVTFNGHAYDIPANWTNDEAWSLTLPFLEYPCEASKKLNEEFAERICDFEFPPITATDNLRKVKDFLQMRTTMTWFSRVKEVAAAASVYTIGHGTLADCSPTGLSSNHVIVDYPTPGTPIQKPTKMADPASRGTFAYKLRSSDRTLPEIAEITAAFAQLNVKMYDTHPYCNALNDANLRQGPYWDIKPQDTSSTDDDSYIALKSIVKKLMLSKV